jgi:uncharacterized protein (TIGR03437 family)
LLSAGWPGTSATAQGGKIDPRVWQKLEPDVPARRALSLQPLTAAPAQQTAELRLDDGSVEDFIQQDGWLVLNRVTPPAYPATLQKLRILFASIQNQPSPVGKPITLVIYADPNGTGQLPANPTLRRIAATVPGASLTNFFEFALTDGPTLQSGDFYIGYQLAAPHQGVSFLFDTNNSNPQAQNRTFISNDNGANFAALPPPTGALSAVALVRGEVFMPNAPNGPTLDVSPSVNFDVVNVGGTADRILTIRNTGTAALNVSNVSSSNPAFTILPPGPPFTIAAGGQQQLSVRFTAAAAGVQNGTLTLESNDPTRPSVTVTLTGSAVVVSNTVVPLTSGTPQSGTLGGSASGGCVLGSTQYSIVVPAGGSALQINLSGTQDVDLYVRFNSAVALQNNQLLADFRAQSLSNDESVTITPATTPGLQPGTYYIGVGNCSSFTANYAVTATVSTGTAGQVTEELNVDDGSPETGVAGNGFIFVNQLSPSRYPSRLQRIRIFVAQFSNAPDPSGATIRLVAFNVPANSPPPTSPSYLVDQNVVIPTITTARYIDFDIPGNPAITEGDWYVGFQAPNPTGGVACVLDLTSTAQNRTYFRGPTAAPFQVLAGANAMIRAVVLSGTQPVCNYAIAPASQNFSASGGAGSVNVTVNDGCNWTALSNANWLTITGGASGSGNGAVNFSVAANTGTAARSGTLTIAGQTFTVTQEGVPCTFTIAPASQNFTASGGTGSVAVTTTNGCAWTAASNAPWVSLTAGAAGDGTGTVTFTVAANPAQTERSGTLSVAGQAFTVTQAAFVCSYAIAPTAQNVAAEGGTSSVNVTAASGCNWAAASNADWLTISSGASGSGNGTVGFAAVANPTASQRTGTLTIAGVTFTVTQAGQPCTYAIAPASQSFAVAGGPGTVNVTALAGCAWTATSNDNWLTITSGASGNGNGSVGFSVAANTAATPRTGTLTVAGLTFTVTQAEQCAYSIAPTSQAVSASASTGSVNVTTTSACAWTAASNAAWLTITSGATGNGNGPVDFAVAANPSVNMRTGTLTLAGQLFTVTQDGAVTNRTVRAAPALGAAGAQVRVLIELQAQGDEHALDFSLVFDPAVLSNPQPETPAAGEPAAVLNTTQVAQGRIGLTLSLNTGQRFEAGTRQLAALIFNLAATASGQTTLSFGDQPTERKVTDSAGNVLPANHTAGVITIAQPVASVSAASFSGVALAPGSMLAAFGTQLATRTELAATLPLPTELAGTTVSVRDSAGTARLAPLFFVAAGQVNYLLPPETATGTATITVTDGAGVISLGTVNVVAVAPSLFTANANGQGAAAGVALRVKADGSQVFEPLAVFDTAQQSYVPVPLDLSDPNEQVFAVFFGTGFRNVNQLSEVTVQIGGQPAPALFAGAQGDLAGLDQLNVQLPRALSGRGTLDVVLTAAGRSANTVSLAVK